MNTKTTLGLALVCVLAGIMVLVIKPWAPKVEEAKAADAESALFDPKPEGFDRIELTRRDGTTLVFVRSAGEEWDMEAPLKAPAARFEVDALAEAVAGIKYDRQYPEDSADRPSGAVSGLDKPVATVKLLKQGKALAEVRVGARAPVGTGNFVQRPDSATIFLAKTDLSRQLDKRLESYRDKRVIKFNLGDVRHVKAEGMRHFELVRNPDESFVLESPQRARADKSKVDEMLRPLTNLYVDSFLDDEPISYRPYGLETPRLRLTVQTEEARPAKAKPGDPDTQPADTQPSVESRTYVLLVGGATDTKGEAYFARLESAPWVFSIRQNTLDSLSPEVAQLRAKALAQVDTTRVRKIEAQTPGGPLALALDDKGQWRFDDQTEADNTFVSDLLQAVRDMQATEFVDPSGTLVMIDWDRPQAKVVLHQTGELTPVTLLVGPPTASGKMVYVRNPAEEGMAAVREEAVAQLLQPPLAYRTRLVMSFKSELVKEIEIERVGTQGVRLAKKGAQWFMSQPVEAPADQEAVRNLLQDFSSLSAKSVVAAGSKADFGLDKPQVSLVLWAEPPAAAPETAVVGEETKATASQPAETAPAADSERDIKVLRELLEYQKSNPDENPLATQMLEQRLAQAVAATQPAGAASTQPTSDPERDIKVLHELLEFQKKNPQENPVATKMLHQLLAERQAQTQPASAPAAPAAPTVATPVALRVHLSRKDGTTYATLPDSDTIYVVEGRVFDDATAELRDRQITRFQNDEVVEIAFRSPDGTLTLRKSGDDWRYLEDPVVPIDKQKVTDILTGLREIRTHRYVDYAAPELGRYGLLEGTDRVSIGLQDARRIEVIVSAAGPEGDADQSRYAALAGKNEVFLLKKDQADKFRQKLEDVEKRN